MQRRALLLAAAAGALSLASAGCAGGPSFIPVRHSTNTEGTARVTLKQVEGDAFTFMVVNQAQKTLVVQTDKVSLRSASGPRKQLPGGSGEAQVEPGAVKDVQVRFDLTGVSSGEQVSLGFDQALSIDGAPVPLPEPIVLQAE